MHNFNNHHTVNKLFQFFIGITFLFFINIDCNAQLTDSIIKVDSSKLTTNVILSGVKGQQLTTKKHSPRKAAWMSTALPGLGQIYNKKYWKVPIIYVGFGALVYSFQVNQGKYVKYRDAYKYRIDGDATTIDNYIGIYSDDNLSALYQYYHRYRDLTVIGAAALYLLQIVDASVDAHLFTFNVSDDLSFHIHPTMMNVAELNQYKTGIGLTIKF